MNPNDVSEGGSAVISSLKDVFKYMKTLRPWAPATLQGEEQQLLAVHYSQCDHLNAFIFRERLEMRLRQLIRMATEDEWLGFQSQIALLEDIGRESAAEVLFEFSDDIQMLINKVDWESEVNTAPVSMETAAKLLARQRLSDWVTIVG